MTICSLETLLTFLKFGKIAISPSTYDSIYFSSHWFGQQLVYFSSLHAYSLYLCLSLHSYKFSIVVVLVRSFFLLPHYFLFWLLSLSNIVKGGDLCWWRIPSFLPINAYMHVMPCFVMFVCLVACLVFLLCYVLGGGKTISSTLFDIIKKGENEVVCRYMLLFWWCSLDSFIWRCLNIGSYSLDSC